MSVQKLCRVLLDCESNVVVQGVEGVVQFLNFNVLDNVTLLTKSFVLNKITFSIQIIFSIYFG